MGRLKRAFAAIALHLGLAVSPGLAQDAPPSPSALSGGAVIRGIVVDAASDQPLRRVTVSATVGGKRVHARRTGADGTFLLPLAGPKEMTRLQATKAGYAGVDIPIPVRAGVAIDIRIAMARGGAISGRVVDETAGVPLPAAAVGVGVVTTLVVPTLQRVAPDGTMTPALPATVTLPNLTDPEARYRFGGLPAGRYAVGFDARAPGSKPAPLPPTIVDLAAGQEIEDVDLFVAMTRPVGAAAPPREGDGAIRGRVSTLGGEPLAGATVVAGRARQVWTAQTDTTGRFAFDGLAAGTFTIRAAKLGYVSLPMRDGTPGAVSIPLAGGEQRDDVDLLLARTGIISGRVADEYGDALQNARVRVTFVGQAGNNITATPDPQFSATTDDRGQFRVAGLTPGVYLVSASAPDELGESEEAYAPIYYPGSRDRRFAAPIALDPEAHVSGLALTLRPIPVGRISGIALDSRGSPAAGTVRLLAPDDASDAFEPRTANAGARGEFDFSRIPAGTYLIEMTANGPSGRELASQQVIVTDPEQPPLVLRTRPAATMTGRLVLEGAPGQQIDGYSMMARRLAGTSVRPGGSHAFSGPISDGTRFTLTDLWGPTRVQFVSPDERWYLRSVVINGVEVADEPFDFGIEGRSFEDVDVVFSASSASIAGRVADERGVAAAGASVVVFPVDASRWFPGSRWVKSAAANAEGSFAVSGLPPGEYFAVAVEDLDHAARQEPSRLLPELVAAATRVRAAAGGGQLTMLRATRR